ncbi:family 43 glycosylhydrolase [Leifsonia sp. ALI-44-B]|uniref:family 43 glycosylhydrolase n=1 Tax=Leifsonia sp. ALI-44-B TaxID=1933776 RepID=UPI001EE6ED29|nr:family 43 glycosylhydrolase [Leifsonia sp. ALI-44-B]
MFANPVLPGCHPDPSICRVGDDYYLVTSTFEYWPGLPIFHSRDLVNWRLIGHAIDRPDQVDLSTVPSSGGLFAATIRHHDGLFFLTCTLVHGQGRRGNFVLTASDPAGPWSDPFWLDEAPGIDPSLFFDHDGRAWLTGTRLAEPGLWAGQTDIWLRELRIERDPVSIALIGDEHLVWRGALHGAVWAEGPHLYRVDGRYYLVAAEGGTEHDHAVSVAVADAVTGPYVGNPANPVLTHRHLGRGFPVTGVGHADLVEHTDGTWWAVVLGSRPVGSSDAQPLGRETFLVPVDWQNGWPVFAPGVGHIAAPFETPALRNPAVFEALAPRHPAAFETPATQQSAPFAVARSTRAVSPSGSASDDPTPPSNSSAGSSPWTFVRTTPEPRAIFSSSPEAFDLIPRPVTLSDVGAPTFVARRQQHDRAAFEATFTVWSDPGVVAGLAVRQSESDWISLSVTPIADPRPPAVGPGEATAADAGDAVRAGDAAGRRDAGRASPVERAVSFTLTLTESRASTERRLAEQSIRVPVSPDETDPQVTVFIETVGGLYGFGARHPAHDPSASELAEPEIRLADVDGAFLTSPVAGGFLGLWLGVFAFSRPPSDSSAPAGFHGRAPTHPDASSSLRTGSPGLIPERSDATRGPVPCVVRVSNAHYEPR